MPVMDDAFVDVVSQRYIHLFETVTGQQFIPAPEELSHPDKMKDMIEAELQKFATTL